jgi:hypothetical protein
MVTDFMNALLSQIQQRTIRNSIFWQRYFTLIHAILTGKYFNFY